MYDGANQNTTHRKAERTTAPDSDRLTALGKLRGVLRGFSVAENQTIINIMKKVMNLITRLFIEKCCVSIILTASRGSRHFISVLSTSQLINFDER
jgi:hypothetical protein